MEEQTRQPFLHQIARGPLWREFESSSQTSLALDVVLGPLTQAFIAKGKVGRHHRFISRNGLVLVMGVEPLGEMERRRVRLCVSIWHRSHLFGEPPRPWGILVRVHCAGQLEIPSVRERTSTLLRAELTSVHAPDAALSIDLGAGRVLSFAATQAAEWRRSAQIPRPRKW
jgi:hypothetical protein